MRDRLALISLGAAREVVVATAALAFVPFSVVVGTPGVAQAAPCAGVVKPTQVPCQMCLDLTAQYHIQTTRQCYSDDPPIVATTSSAPPLVIPAAPPPTPRAVPPIHPPPSTVEARTPKVPKIPTGPTRGSGPLVAPPKGLDATPQAVAAAKAAPATRIDPANPPKPPTQVGFADQVQNAVNAHGGHVDIVKVNNQKLVRPRHWEYVDYANDYHCPSLYNPLDRAMTFRFSYNGADREAYLPAGGHILLGAGTVGLFPFTAVGDGYVASGSFYGGGFVPPDGTVGPPPPNYPPPAPPELYQDVSADVPASNQTVEVSQVQVVGHDANQPAGSQDMFWLDDSTLAWGQINDPGGNAQIRVTKTQSLPGVGPTDNGGLLVALAASPQDTPQPAKAWWPMALGYGALGAAGGVVAWMISRRKEESESGE